MGDRAEFYQQDLLLGFPKEKKHRKMFVVSNEVLLPCNSRVRFSFRAREFTKACGKKGDSKRLPTLVNNVATLRAEAPS